MNRTQILTELYKFSAFMVAWALPSTTLVYVILSEYMNWNLYYAYIGATIISGIFMYPIMRYTASGVKQEKK